MKLDRTIEFDAQDMQIAVQRTQLAIKVAQSYLDASTSKQQRLTHKVTEVYLKMDVLADCIQDTKRRWKVA